MNKEEVLYQIVALDSELKKGFPDKITTILKNGCTGKTYTDYDFKNHRYLYCFINDNFNIYDRLEEKNKEIERLNNIINEILEMVCCIEHNLDKYEEIGGDHLEYATNKVYELKEYIIEELKEGK